MKSTRLLPVPVVPVAQPELAVKDLIHFDFFRKTFPRGFHPMLLASELECVKGERRLFTGISFAVRPGELLHIQGANGAGKTSLLRIALGIAPPEKGDV